MLSSFVPGRLIFILDHILCFICTYDHLITLETPAASEKKQNWIGVAVVESRSIHSGHKNRSELTDLPTNSNGITR